MLQLCNTNHMMLYNFTWGFCYKTVLTKLLTTWMLRLIAASMLFFTMLVVVHVLSHDGDAYPSGAPGITSSY